jgi:alpha-glucoside transport system permease protein
MSLQSNKSPQNLTDILTLAPIRLLVSLIVPVLTFIVMYWSFNFMNDKEAPKLLVMLVGLFIGIFGVWILYWSSDNLVSALPTENLRQGIRPFVFVGPAMMMLLTYLIYPTFNTIYLSFQDARSVNFVGLQNYVFAFTSPDMKIAFVNNITWLIVVTTGSVIFGLLVAVLVDRVSYEGFAKSLIFLPMAISFVGASVIWRFVYAYQPANRPQIGILNALLVFVGGQPIGWLIERSFNNFALMAIMIWLQTGFCMVILSAALKGVPTELMEAARIDGANEWQIFFSIVVPQIYGTIITVATTVAIAVLKVFDVVFVMTSGQHGTEVIANRMYVETFRNRDFGHGSALSVILLIAVIPIIVVNIRNFREQRKSN